MSNIHKRGFASMSPERRAALASLGGRSVAAENRAFSKDRKLASKAGSKGGIRSPKEKTVGPEN